MTSRPESPSIRTPAREISRPNTPPTPVAHSSPSFDYHEERRLHLQDEIYFSHRLPRLPPPALEPMESLGSSYSSASGQSMNHASRAMEKGMSADASPIAFHPIAPSGHMRNLALDEEEKGGQLNEDDEDVDEEAKDQMYEGLPGGGRAGHRIYTGSSPSLAPAYSDADPKTNLLRSEEQDSQERLDLAEETRERELAEGKANGTGAQTAATGPPALPENGIGSALDSLYASFSKCLDLRDKYIALSNQRLGDNPRDHDGTFRGFYPREMGDVLGVKPEADVEVCEKTPTDPSYQDDNKLPTWRINPPPPPPHWHWRPPAAQGQMPHLEHRDSGGPDTPTGDVAGSSSNGYVKKTAGRSDMEVFDVADFEIPTKDQQWTFGMNEEGVFEVFTAQDIPKDVTPAPTTGGDASTSTSTPAPAPAQRLARVPSLKEYFSDLDFLLNVCSDGPAKSFAFRRLKYLASKWSLYCLLNEYQELADMKAVPHRDFYNVRKVDTHIHHSASMNQKHLLRFIKAKLKKAPNEIVIHRDGKDLTLAEVFESLNLTAYDLSIDTLDMHAHQEFHRFDRFNDRYNPNGSSRLREIFLKTDNLLKGKYLAELTKELITDLEQSKYQQCEWRLSIYGRNIQEWDTLAKWVVNNKLVSHNVRWLIQVPRLYEIFKRGGLISNFEDVVRNVFQPLFEVTADPSSHPELHIFLQRVVGFDSVDDESKPERRLYRKFPTAKMWDTKQSPPYSYWIYYMYANMASLNAWRRERRFNTFVLRPHCGEAGDPDHLSSAFLTSHSISHGILLRKVPALQYLFYLKQIGLAMSPLSNNALFLTYERNPFKDFFRTGLNVSLSTDDPLQFHFTQSHLLEEYSCAAQIYKLTPADMCELARNSVLQSGWEMAVKKHWIGNRWYLPGASGNDIHKTNVPTSRLTYRHQTLLEELTLIRRGTASPSATPGHLQTAHPSQLPLAPPFPQHPSSPTTRLTPAAATSMTEDDIGAAAMEPTKAAFSELASHAGLGGMGGMTSVAGTSQTALPPSVGPGVGALDEKIHRKRTESMGKGMNMGGNQGVGS